MSPLLSGALQALVVMVGGVVVVLVGAPVVQAVFRRVDRSTVSPRGAEASADSQPAGVVAAATQLRGGAWIGRLERLAIYAGLVAHYPEAIAICLAMKGLARYPELKATTTGAAERFIIGTFVSVLVACSGAGLVLGACRLVEP
ncbi:hypothetical protein EDD41_0458 [Luteococcus japonicus]|uniref:Uncharacterized protein n=2 Tax=Luteococcus japonicus TaxID=33984 RepID=A0A1R4K3Q8_9ACTN|nr:MULTISPECIES: hypothetical protein [Luteococcus]MDN5563341.1 hypothetical protein [Luteococcus sp.]ROR53318.1 hypothetical protein EDD41_0458 [Luteococcus japonicus]SJN38957.1 hypothetical protein FM114_11255 [Luteococcus japonicus LSP_Lj1]